MRAVASRLCSLLGIFLALAAASGCGPVTAAEHGESLARDRALSPSPSNLFACTTCHATQVVTEAFPRRLPGATLLGAAQRPRLWGGKLTYLRDAVDQCLVDFMRGTRLLEDDLQGLALLAYLQSIAPAPDTEKPCTVVQNVDTNYLAQVPMGNAERGEVGYRLACAYCHGQVHTGSGRLGERVSIVPDDTIRSFGAAQARAIIIEKVRHGRYFGIGGNMPFYCQEVLSDAELGDIMAYMLQ